MPKRMIKRSSKAIPAKPKTEMKPRHFYFTTSITEAPIG